MTSLTNKARPAEASNIVSVALDEDVSHRWSRLSLQVVGLCFFINAVDGMNVFLMSYLAPSLTKDWSLSPATLGEVFSAALVGMAIGGLILAPLGDRYGRRPLILASLLMMSAGMVFSGFAAGVFVLLLARVLVGTGIGTVLACMTALVAEFAPPHRRSFAVGLLQGGYPIGATITGFVTAAALVHHSWRAILLFSGFGSLVFFPLAFFLLPESAAFLAHLRGRGALTPLNYMNHPLDEPSPDPAPSFNNPAREKHVLSTLLGRQLRHDTLFLWCAIFFGYMVLYSIVSWIPKLAVDAGLNPSAGIYAGSIYNIGAFVGTVLLARLADSAGLKLLITFFLVAAAALLLLFGGLSMPVPAVLCTAFAIGVTLQGGFNGIYPLATCVYPVKVRSSGLGWAMGLGRSGAVLGPMLAGFILSRHVPLPGLFLTLAVSLLIAAACTASIRHATH
jgi:benzoate transport